MAITINGILCQELVTNPIQEGFDILGGPTARKGFFVQNWSDRYTVAQGLIGLATSTSVGGTITFNTPAKYPERDTMYAHQIEISGVGSPTQGARQVTYPSAIVWCNYACLPWSFEGIETSFPFMQIDPATPMIYCKQHISTSTSWMTLRNRGLKFANGNKLKKDFAMPLFQAEIQLTFIRVPYFPAQQIFVAGLNPINSSTFLGMQTGFVLFNGSDTEATRDSAGNMTLDITYSFSFRNIKWCADWDPTSQTFQIVQVLGSGDPIIGSSDLNSIIPPGYVF